MGIVAGLAIGAGAGLSAISNYNAGQAAKRVGEVNARGIEEASELNAQLVEEGAEANAQIAEFNARLNEALASDALWRGHIDESNYRKAVRGLIGEQRVSFAGQNVDVNYGTPLDIQTDTAYQGELDALMIRTNAAREAWGYTAEAQNDLMQADAQRRLGTLQARGIRTSGRYDALSSRMGGSSAATAGKYAAVSSVLSGTGQIATIYRKGA